MEITLLTFGIAKEIIGTPVSTLHVADTLKAGELKARLEEQYPALQKLSSFMIAVNGSYADTNDIIKAGDEVAIIPPVSGG